MKFTDDSGAFDNTVVDLASHGRPRRFSAGTTAPKSRELTANELTTLGLLALNAADEAREAGNEPTARRYVAIAAKCDYLAGELVKP